MAESPITELDTNSGEMAQPSLTLAIPQTYTMHNIALYCYRILDKHWVKNFKSNIELKFYLLRTSSYWWQVVLLARDSLLQHHRVHFEDDPIACTTAYKLFLAAKCEKPCSADTRSHPVWLWPLSSNVGARLPARQRREQLVQFRTSPRVWKLGLGCVLIKLRLHHTSLPLPGLEVIH